MLVLSLAVPSPLGANERFEKKRHEAVYIMVCDQNNIAALAAITTIRPSTRNEFFPAKTAATIPSITRFGVHADFIDKFHAGKVADPFLQVESEFKNVAAVLIVECQRSKC